MTLKKVIAFYDLMDAAYDVPAITEYSKSLGHVPIISKNPRRDKQLQEALKSGKG